MTRPRKEPRRYRRKPLTDEEARDLMEQRRLDLATVYAT